MSAASRLRERKAGQVQSLIALEEDRGEMRDAAEALSERYEDVKDKGDELRIRVEGILAKLQSRVPHLSDKELAMGREVVGLERRVEALEGGIKQLVEKERYQRCQVEASTVGRKELNKGQLDNFKQESQSDENELANKVEIAGIASRQQEYCQPSSKDQCCKKRARNVIWNPIRTVTKYRLTKKLL